MTSEPFRLLRAAPFLPAAHTPCPALVLALSGLLALSACSIRPAAHIIALPALESAEFAATRELGRVLVCDAPAIAGSYTPLGPRLALIHVRTRAEWERLHQAAPGLGVCPDLSRGSVIGMVSRAGLPLEPVWPFQLESVRVLDGAGLVAAHFEGGCYLPDETTYLDAAYVRGLAQVLVVEVNGVRFYPE